MLFVGDDWAEAHHDVEIARRARAACWPAAAARGGAGWPVARADRRASRRRRRAGAGAGRDRDRPRPWVQALVAAGYTVYAVNPLQVARYRERHATSGAKSDPGDAHVLAEIVRLDRAHHRPVAGDSELAEQSRSLARAHQTMIWSRQRQANQLRSMLREFYPAALEAFATTWPAATRWRCWPSRPHPGTGKTLTRARVVSVLRRAGRQRNLADPRRGDPDRAAHRAARARRRR